MTPSAVPSASKSHDEAPSRRSALLTAAQLTVVRLRFLLLIGGILAVVAAWPWLRNHWERWTHVSPSSHLPVSLDTEYWCPMCPGVLSEWPSKCPVCNMALVRRKKGEATPLPDGVVARMQLSPYRVQLAGVKTTPAEYRTLIREGSAAGVVQMDAIPSESKGPAPLLLRVEVPERDLALWRSSNDVEVKLDALPGKTFAGKVSRNLHPWQLSSRTGTIAIALENPRREVAAGMLATAVVRMPISRTEWQSNAWSLEWRDRTLLDGLGRALVGAPEGGGTEPLTSAAIHRALLQAGLVLAIPEMAVVDTGSKRVVFVERMPGLFDALEVALGPRCDGYYPVLRGLQAGDRIVTAGAFLLDAETRLNPSIAASYFGANRAAVAANPTGGADDRVELTPKQKEQAAKQRICPVTSAALDSMGGPVPVVVRGETVYICCKACEGPLRKDPDKHLAKLRPSDRK